MTAVSNACAEKLCFRDFEFDLERLDLGRAGVPVKAERVTLRLLAVLIRDPGQLVGAAELCEQVWGRPVSNNVITVAIVRLRKTLGHVRGQVEFVVNDRGRGYRFVCPVSRRALSGTCPAQVLAHPSTVPFVGRERALHALRNAWAESNAGRGGACVLSGEPGIGKTRLIEAFELEASAAGGFVGWGNCHESGDTPALWPFAQLVRQFVTWSSKKAERLQLRAAVSKGLPAALSRMVPEIAGGLTVGPVEPDCGHSPSDKHQLFDAITQLFARVAALTPCVLVLDDLHHADLTSLELLQYWSDELAHTRVLLLATLQRYDLSEPAARAKLAYVCGHRNTTRLGLHALSEDAVASYVSAILDDPNGELGRAVFAKSEGNPFIMAELVRRLHGVERASSSAIAFPIETLDPLRRWLGRIDASTRAALSCAAVIGRRFELSMLKSVSAEHTTALMFCLDSAIAHGVVACVGDSRISFAFTHQLLRDALYEALAPERRRTLHLQVAQALEHRWHNGGRASVTELAHHFCCALPESDVRTTVRYCSEAAKVSYEACAYADGQRYVAHARQALALLHEPSARLGLELLLRETLEAALTSLPDAVSSQQQPSASSSRAP